MRIPDPAGASGTADATGTGAGAGDSTDAVEHLWAAAHELLQAARTVIDAADVVVLEQQQRAAARARPASASAPRLRRIDVG